MLIKDLDFRARFNIETSCWERQFIEVRKYRQWVEKMQTHPISTHYFGLYLFFSSSIMSKTVNIGYQNENKDRKVFNKLNSWLLLSWTTVYIVLQDISGLFNSPPLYYCRRGDKLSVCAYNTQNHACRKLEENSWLWYAGIWLIDWVWFCYII